MFNMAIQIVFLSSVIASVIGIVSLILYLNGNTALTKHFLFYSSKNFCGAFAAVAFNIRFARNVYYLFATGFSMWMIK